MKIIENDYSKKKALLEQTTNNLEIYNHDYEEHDNSDDDNSYYNHEHEDYEEDNNEDVFAIDYDTNRNAQLVTQILSTPPEESIIYTGNESNSDEETNVSLTTMGIRLNITIPDRQTYEDRLRNIITPSYTNMNYQIHDNLNSQENEEEAYDSF